MFALTRPALAALLSLAFPLGVGSVPDRSPLPIPISPGIASPDSGVVVTLIQADRAEVAMARSALPSLKDADVKRYAQQVLDGHAANETATERIAERLKIPVGAAVAPTAGAGPVDDPAYLSGTIARHQQMLAVLPADGSGIMDAALRQHVVATRRDVQMHLDEGMRLQSKVGRTTTP